jgi:hypothetical protein
VTRRLLALPFEIAHVLGMACFFAIGLALTLLTAPEWAANLAKVSPDAAARHFNEVASLIGRNGLWLACAALAGGIAAPYARKDGKKLLAWLRVACAAIAVVIVLLAWGRFESMPNVLDGSPRRAADLAKWRSDRAPTPWNGLLLATGLNLGIAAFQISGGAAKKPKAESKEK